MKVLQINSVCGIRSTGRICADIAEVLELQGKNCVVAYGRESVPEKYKKYSYLIANKWDNYIDAFKTRIFDNAGFNSTKRTKEFVKWIKQYDPDVIHLHNLHGYYINVEVLFQTLKEIDKPVIWTLHDCWPFTGHCAYFDTVACEKWKTGCYACALKNIYPASGVMDRSKSNYQAKKECFLGVKDLTIVTPSQWLADLVKQSFLHEYDVKVIHNGINLTVFKPSEGNFRTQYGLQNKKVILGVAAFWSKTKGYNDMLQLAGMLPDAYRMVLVGVTPKQKKGLPKNIIGITRTNNVEQLAEIYTAADVFVNPTYQDNYPTVNLEAQSCGTPVITYRTGGSIESVPAGQIVEKGDVEGLYRAVLNSDGYELYPGDFSAKTAFNKYIQLYGTKIDRDNNVV